MLVDVLPCKAALTVSVIAVKDANTSQSKSTWSPIACTYPHTAGNYENAGALVVNSVFFIKIYNKRREMKFHSYKGLETNADGFWLV